MDIQYDVPLPGFCLNVDICNQTELHRALETFRFQSGHDGDTDVSYNKCSECSSEDIKYTRMFSITKFPQNLIVKTNRFIQAIRLLSYEAIRLLGH